MIVQAMTKNQPFDEDALALRTLMMPRDVNAYGTIFGGVIMGQMDLAALVQARKHASVRWVTVAMDRVEFVAPVHVGDAVNYLTSTLRTGTSSVCVKVKVDAERGDGSGIARVTEAELTMVAVDNDGRPTPFLNAQSPSETGS